MKQLRLENGGRPFVNDDLDTLQSELSGLATVLLPELGLCVLQGCTVRPGSGPDLYTISAGVVYLDRVRRFAGAEDVALPGWIVLGGLETSDPRVMETGATEDCYQEHMAVWTNTPPSATIASYYITYTAQNPGYTYWQLAQAKQRTRGEIQWLSVRTAAEYTATGLGIGPARGWALCNGEHGTADLRARFVLGLNEVLPWAPSLTPNQLGATGGEETVRLTEAEMPAHTHNVSVYRAVERQGDNGDNRTTLDTGYRDNTFTTTAVGGNAPHNNMPPYIVLAARQWIGF